MKSRILIRLATVTMLALVLSGVALATRGEVASALAATADAPVEYGNANCGDPVLGAPVPGTVRFLRSGDTLMLRYAMTAGDATTAYDVFLFDADTCKPLARLGSFATDAAGVGRLTTKQVSVVGSSRFYAVARDTSNFVGLTHGSLAVDLP